ncbi:MAG: inorganic phosphate transporter [Chlamydiota bacterium]|nr:inorganic phosphate transporter [Chlamydiota bacterium]
MDPIFIICAVVVIAVFFDFANGWNDSANAIATVVSTRVLTPGQAVFMAAIFNFIGAYLSTKVAKTIGGSIVDPMVVTQGVVFFAMVTACIWVSVATFKGLPISASHSLIGGLIGAGIGKGGIAIVKWKGVMMILTALFVSPLLGMLFGFIFMKILGRTISNFSYGKVNRVFGKLQIVSSAIMALSHGTNDAQKVMGVITLALFSGGFLTDLTVPLWVIFVCAMAIACGTAVGGWKVIKTLGTDLMDLRPVHGFVAETSAAGVLFGAAALGIPVSTTHCITSSIVGVGAAKRKGGVRWGIGKSIMYAWILTLPFCMLLGYLFIKAAHFIF